MYFYLLLKISFFVYMVSLLPNKTSITIEKLDMSLYFRFNNLGQFVCFQNRS